MGRGRSLRVVWRKDLCTSRIQIRSSSGTGPACRVTTCMGPTDANNYERLTATYMPGDGYFELIGQKQGTGGQRGICLGGTGARNWAVDILGTLKPFTDNVKHLGGVTLRPRDVYVGRNLVMYGTASRYNATATAGWGWSRYTRRSRSRGRRRRSGPRPCVRARAAGKASLW